jgi:ferredoxin/flavodoxin---NADP+ reductase
MYDIVYKQTLSEFNKLVVVNAPEVARKASPGQFVIVRIDEQGERIPLTIADYDRDAGTVTLVFQQVGKSTMSMGELTVGEGFRDLVGPLGHPTQIDKLGTVVCVGGGVAIAAIYPIARGFKAAGNQVLSIIGARNHELLFWTERMKAVSDELVVVTDDGSYGRRALVTEPLRELLEARAGEIAGVYAVGPAPMMKACVRTAQPFDMPVIVSLNTVMVDGTGMCGGCRVEIAGETRFVCVDGPSFDGHLVDWDMLMARLAFYHEEEQYAVEHWQRECRLLAAGEEV